MKIVRIGRPPFQLSLLEELRQFQTIFHPDPSLDSYRVLKAAGLNILPLGSNLPSDSDTDGENAILIPIATGAFEKLVQIGDRLLAPGGCPWDQAQTHSTLKKYLIEECYELCDAIDDDEPQAMLEELGDVILQPIMHAAMTKRDGKFAIDEVCDFISDKLIRRHPHVFGSAIASSAEEVLKNWDSIKMDERMQSEKSSILSGIPRSAPSLMRAMEISKRASRQGFEWSDIESVWLKLEEELSEWKHAIEIEGPQRAFEELGDVLFTIVNIARWLKIEPEDSLNSMLNRFVSRFKWMESNADIPLSDLSAEDWDSLWKKAKIKTTSQN